MLQPQTHYARSGDVSVAYQVVGEGDIDLVLVYGWISQVEYLWENPGSRHVLERLASFARVIHFDKRGSGLSDRVATLPALEERMDDVRTVLDAVGSEHAAIFGLSEGGAMSILFAATYPERTSALILYGATAKLIADDDHPWGAPPEAVDATVDMVAALWGTGATAEIYAPSMAEDRGFREWWSRFERLGGSPGAMSALLKMNAEVDVRSVLPSIRVPTLVMHRRGDRAVNWRTGQYIAQHIPDAKWTIFPGIDHHIAAGDSDPIIDEVQEFLTGVRPAPEPDRVLCTVMFTDIVDSTKRAVELGDRRWREVLDAHNAAVRRELARFRGREVKTIGDGFLALFDGPARAIRCGQALNAAVETLGIRVRAGLHTGECELIGDDIGGVAVHIAARVSALAQGGEILVSSTVKDLVAGSGIRFAERGTFALKGVPDEWRLFSVAQP
ncbi:MAG: alpha/beta fold hydrolase [Gaiellales bacterium]